MKIKIFIVSLLFVSTISYSATVEEKVNQISSLIFQYPDSASFLATQLYEESVSDRNEYGLVQSNFILAYINHKVTGDFGKAIIYYLEAIRHAEKSSYTNVKRDLISLHKNCGVVFRKFKAFLLAEEYYMKGLAYADESNNLKEIISIKYNLSGVFLDQEDYSKSIETLESIKKLVEKGSNKYADVLSRLCLVHLRGNNLNESEAYATLIINDLDINKYVETISYAYQNLGVVNDLKGNYELAEYNFLKAIQLMRSVNDLVDPTPLFLIYKDLGGCYWNSKTIDLSQEYFSRAEELIPNISQNPEYFELYKSRANLYYELGEYKKSKHYEDLYAKSLTEYLELQQEIRETDQRYNMDLITKRYFDQVEKQEQIADIMFYSKLISGLLLFLLVASISYTIYGKVRLRKSIEKELIALKIVD